MNKAVAEKIEKFFEQYRTKSYQKGHILILNEEDARHVYQLVKGSVKEYDVTHRGDEIILNVFKPPAFFPMSLAINKVRNPYMYEADTDIEVRQVPADEAVEFLKTNPDVTFDLLSRVYRGVDGLLGRVAHLMASSAKRRLMYEIVIECRRFGKVDDKGRYTIALNESQLGSRAGLSRETVSREMNKLITDGIVQFSGGKIIVNDLEILEEKMNRTA